MRACTATQSFILFYISDIRRELFANRFKTFLIAMGSSQYPESFISVSFERPTGSHQNSETSKFFKSQVFLRDASATL